jgi:hypothetical protein
MQRIESARPGQRAAVPVLVGKAGARALTGDRKHAMPAGNTRPGPDRLKAVLQIAAILASVMVGVVAAKSFFLDNPRGLSTTSVSR